MAVDELLVLSSEIWIDGESLLKILSCGRGLPF